MNNQTTFQATELAPAHRATTNKYLNLLLWPLALVSVLHRTWALPLNPTSTDDFTTVYRAIERFTAGLAVYNENYLNVDPHYLYSPGATLLLSPLAWLPTYDVTRLTFAVLQSISIVLALTLLLRWNGVKRGSWLLPAVITAAYHSEAVVNTLQFTNVNGSIFLLVVGTLVLLTPHRLSQNLVAGLLLGIAITIKPVVAPLLFLPFVRKQFAALAAAIAVPIVTNLIAWPLMSQPADYVRITLPYLGVVRDYANSSLPGQLTWFGANPTLIVMWQAFFAGFVILSLLLLLRFVERDEKFWLSSTAGLLLTGAFFLSSLGQQYYSMLLLPMVFSVIRPLRGVIDAYGLPTRSVVLSWPAALALALCFFSGSWMIGTIPLVSYWFGVAIGGIGWGLLILSITGYLIRITIEDYHSGRSLLFGLDWLRRWPRREPRPAQASEGASTVPSAQLRNSYESTSGSVKEGT